MFTLFTCREREHYIKQKATHYECAAFEYYRYNYLYQVLFNVAVAFSNAIERIAGANILLVKEVL